MLTQPLERNNQEVKRFLLTGTSRFRQGSDRRLLLRGGSLSSGF
jgi:hypothetical protein